MSASRASSSSGASDIAESLSHTRTYAPHDLHALNDVPLSPASSSCASVGASQRGSRHMPDESSGAREGAAQRRCEEATNSMPALERLIAFLDGDQDEHDDNNNVDEVLLLAAHNINHSSAKTAANDYEEERRLNSGTTTPPLIDLDDDDDDDDQEGDVAPPRSSTPRRRRVDSVAFDGATKPAPLVLIAENEQALIMGEQQEQGEGQSIDRLAGAVSRLSLSLL